jgi:hypothetical protein
MTASARPLTLGEILDRTVQLYRRNFLLFAGISVLPSALNVLVSGGASIYLLSQLPAISGEGPNGGQALLVFVGIFLVFVVVALPFLLVVYAVALAALNYAAMEVNLGVQVTIRASHGFAFRHFWRHVGVLFLQALLAWVVPYCVFVAIAIIGGVLATLIGLTRAGSAFAALFAVLIFVFVIALLVVCILIWLRFSLAFPACVAEGKKAWASLKRSNQLSKGTRGRIFVMFLMVFVLAAVVYYALTLPVDFLLGLTMHKSLTAGPIPGLPPLLTQIVNLVISFFERTLVMPVYAIAQFLFFNDQRTRQEGYDIEQLMVQAGWNELAPAPACAPAVPAGYDPAVDPAFASALTPSPVSGLDPSPFLAAIADAPQAPADASDLPSEAGATGGIGAHSNIPDAQSMEFPEKETTPDEIGPEGRVE